MNLKSSLFYPLLKPFVPLLVGGTYHLFKQIASTYSFMGSNLNSHNGGRNQKFSDSSSRISPDSEPIPSGFLGLLNQISFGIYENFFAFLLSMFLIDIICKIAQNGCEGFWKEVMTSQKKGLNDSKKKSKLLNVISENHLMIRIFSYAVIFISLQISGLCLSYVLNESLTKIIRNPQNGVKIQSQEEYFGLPRILSQEEGIQNNEPLSTMSSDKISLSMRNILSSLNINVNAMVLSKNRRIAYATLNLYGTLNIIDISDLKSPVILGSLSLKSSSFGYRIKNLLLSSDEKTLYASNSRELEIIDVTDPESPKLLSFTKSEIFTDDLRFLISEYFRTSLAISESTRTLYIGGLGLQVYDISNPKKPSLLKTVKHIMSEELSEGALVNEICLSRDGQVLFIANGTLDIYNISNPKDIKPINSLKTKSDVRSLLLSEDGKTIFGLESDETGMIIFEEIDISNYGSLKIRKTFRLGHKSINSPRFLTVSPSKSKFFIYANSDRSGANIKLLVFDYIKQTTIEIDKRLMEDTFVMNFSPDGRTLLTGSNSQFLVIELYLDYPNRQIYSGAFENQISNFSLSNTCTDLHISNDGKYLFVVRKAWQKVDNPSYEKVFEIWNVSDTSAPHVLGSYGTQDISEVQFAKNYDLVYLRGEDFITVLDISDKSTIIEKKTYKAEQAIKRIFKLVTSSDGETGFLFINKEGKGLVTFLNFSQPTSGIEGFVTLDREFTMFETFLILKDDKTLIVLDEEILFYDVSNLAAPVRVASLPYGPNEAKPEIGSYDLSPDKQVLFIHTSDRNYFTKLRIYNISNIKSPHLISDNYFSKYLGQPMPPKFSFPPQSESAFFYQGWSLIKLNLTDLKKPKISGNIPLECNKISGLAISPDGQVVYAVFQDQVRILNVNIEYTLYLNKERYSLGEKYSNKVSMLRLSGKSDYNLMDTKSYRIIKLSLLDVQIAPNKYILQGTSSPLPSWMSFDEGSNTLTLNPKKQSEMGSYTLYSTFSLKIPVDVFNGSGIGTVKKPIISENLIAWLISLDYLDSDLFLTDKFKSLETFYLPAEFLDYKEQIFHILKGYYVGTCTMFDVTSSLEFNENNLMVSSLSTNNIKAEITVQPREGSEVKLVNVPYGGLLPVIRENKTRVVLEGTINEINVALKSVVVNFENGTSSGATVVIKDGLNPQVSVEILNISKYFKTNRAPRLSNNPDHQTLQEQIDIADIQTGKYFTFTLSNDIFQDDYAESLTYEMGMVDNNTAFPTWLSFNGLTLKGTPPEEIVGRELDLVLVAKNEFKESRAPFKLRIKISTVFWLKLLSRYSPYILTCLGLLVSANKIFNIIAKRRYRHPKEYHLNVGEEITPDTIPPVLFIGEELKQSEVILKSIKKTWTDFVENSTGVLNKEKIQGEIKETIQEIPFKEREKMNRCPSPIIDQIIINKFVLTQLDSDTKTKSLFEELKPKCLEVIERGGPSGFTINQDKLKKLLMSLERRHSTENLEESLIPSTGINVNLLKDAILAYTFDVHSLDTSPVDIDISIKQLVPSRLLFSFLKLDLRDINLNDKNKVDYGINYRIIDDKLCFYGVPHSYFQKKTLAVQIKTLRHKILKEIWIQGVPNNLQESFIVQEERENRGQGYEIF